ncbi:MAG TPA: thioesterase family protein [Ramlibacter sp.]|uniref:acyl-CoA thioesterase n=1 Tax=Ramlibacter sp. TaxID=1917967 RepID=UPI002ED28AB4
MLKLVDDGSPPGPVLFEAVLPVRWGDLDADGHVNNTVMLRYAEEARMQWAAALKLQAEAPDRMPVVAAIACSFHAPVHHPATLRIRVSCSRVGRSSLDLTFAIDALEANAARSCATAYAVWVWVDQATRKSVPIPAPLRALCETPLPA